MTCVLALRTPRGILMASDSIECAGPEASTLRVADAKLFRVAGMLAGSSGSTRVAQLLRFARLPTAKGTTRDLVRTLVPAIRRAIERGGHVAPPKDDDGEPSQAAMDGDLLLAVRGSIFRVNSDLSVTSSTREYDAVGVGAAWATGSLYTTRDTKLSPERRVTLALEASAEHCALVRGPWVIKWARRK